MASDITLDRCQCGGWKGDYEDICILCVRDAAPRTHRALAHGLTEDDYDAMLEAQGGVCYVCGKGGPLVIDHDHDCGTEHGTDHRPAHGCPRCVRKLLCTGCNAWFGRGPDASIRRIMDHLSYYVASNY